MKLQLVRKYDVDKTWLHIVQDDVKTVESFIVDESNPEESEERAKASFDYMVERAKNEKREVIKTVNI